MYVISFPGYIIIYSLVQPAVPECIQPENKTLLNIKLCYLVPLCLEKNMDLTLHLVVLSNSTQGQ